VTTIYLIRHGQKEIHAGNPALTKIGVNQAKETGVYLSQFPISKIISSPTKRTIETAENIAQVLNLPYSSDNDLVERMDWIDPSVSRDEFLQEWVKSTNNRDYVPKYGDSSRDAGKRVGKLINKMTTDNHIVLVTHGGAILDYLRNLFGDKRISALRKHYNAGDDYQMNNCAINKVILDDEPTLELLNFIEHLSNNSE
jgi:broad specificity phosphatase PhoE